MLPGQQAARLTYLAECKGQGSHLSLIHILNQVGQRYADQLANMKDNPYMQLRSVDILDASRRVINIKFHKKGFEIYGVSFDNNRDKWLAAVKDNGMKWIQT